jgi:cytochrome-b5 reductase
VCVIELPVAADFQDAMEPFVQLWLQYSWVLAVLLVVASIAYSTFSSSQSKVFLNGKEFQQLPLADKRNITHNTVFFRFALPHKNMRLGLPIGQHISFLMKGEDGKDVYRAYTPVSDDAQLGFVDFVIKVYPQGKMSQILDKLNLGDTVGMKGPRGKFQYQPNMKRALGTLAVCWMLRRVPSLTVCPLQACWLEARGSLRCTKWHVPYC